MMNIKEYFDNLYMTATTDKEWAEEHNIDLTAMGNHGISILQCWAWDFED